MKRVYSILLLLLLSVFVAGCSASGEDLMNFYGSDYQEIKPSFGILSSRGDDGNGNKTYTFSGVTITVNAEDTVIGIDIVFANESEERFHVLGINQNSTLSDVTKKLGEGGTTGSAEGYAGTITFSYTDKAAQVTYYYDSENKIQRISIHG